MQILLLTIMSVKLEWTGLPNIVDERYYITPTISESNSNYMSSIIISPLSNLDVGIYIHTHALGQCLEELIFNMSLPMILF